MKAVITAILLIFVGGIGWRIGGSLSSDAMGMAIGMLFGIMAGIPTALLMLASEKRRDDYHREHYGQPRRPQLEALPPPQVVNNITNNFYAAPRQPRERRAEVETRNALPGPAPEMPAPRRFRVIGNEEQVDR
ncbi:MAG: hypothetical protein H6641_15740 [Caldilineaceae bacterium]|nr:hypothetical protein [Caldilineaceae bacterium]